MKKCRVIAIVLVLSLLIAPTSAFATQKEGYIYTALGDSIAAGVGGTGGIGYTDLFNEHLTRIYGEGIFNDYAMSGLTTLQLNDVINMYPGDIVTSDKITISIGGNDILGPVIYFVGMNPQYLDPDILMAELMKDPGSWDPALQAVNGQLSYALLLFDGLWEMNIATIRGMNNGAQIFVNTLYNPFKDNQVLYEYADPFITAINASIISKADIYGYEVVDVYTKVNKYNNPKKLLIHNIPSLNPLDAYLHPTDYGYKMIYNLHKKILMP
jgi:lysophospholipase L1-like esterase